MRALRIVKITIRTIFWIVLAIVLLATGLLLTLYSQWGQNMIKDIVLNKLNANPDTQIEISDFSLHFPAQVDLSGVRFVQRGDTTIAADTLRADVKLLPLLRGKVDIKEARLINGLYCMGGPDSAMYLKIKAHEIDLSPAAVTLGKLNIELENGIIRHGIVDLTLNPVKSSETSDSTAKTDPLLINIRKLKLEDFAYRMRMLPTIDSLDANIASGTLQNGQIDLEKQRITLSRFIADSVSAAYIAPDSATIAATSVIPPSDSTSPPWTITIDTIHLRQSTALYTTQGYKPLPGLDFSYIQADNMDLKIVDFYNQATTLKLPLTLSATERCGVALDATGTFALDSLSMYFQDFNIHTDDTYLNVNGMMGVGDLLTDAQLPLMLYVNGYCGTPDLSLMFPAFEPYLKPLSRPGRIDTTLDLKGTAGDIEVSELMLAIKGCATLTGEGNIQNAFDPENIGGDIDLVGHIFNVKNMVKALTTPDLQLMVPPMILKGNIAIRHGVMNGNLKAKTLGGNLALDAKFNSNNDGYDLDLKTDKFPLNAFLTDMGLGAATIDLQATGQGFDIFSNKTQADISGKIISLIYQEYNYHDITFDLTLHDGEAVVEASANTNALVATINAHGNLWGDTYAWEASINGENIDMEMLNLSTTRMALSTQVDIEAKYAPKTNDINARINIPELEYKGDADLAFNLSDINAIFLANDSLTELKIHNNDLNATATLPVKLADISTQFSSAMLLIDEQIKQRKIDVDTLQKVLPQFALDITAGDNNLINDILSSQEMNLEHLALSASNDTAIYVKSEILKLTTGTTTLDTIKLVVNQDVNRMHIIGELDNKPGNLNDWAHVTADALLNTDRLALRMTQQNEKYETGFDLGAITVFGDSTVTARMFPLTPTIGYKKWTVNFDNFIFYNFMTHHIDANLKMKGADSSLQLYTDHGHNLQKDLNDSIPDSNNTIILKISDIHLQDWIAFNPFAPPISGNLSADVNVMWNGGNDIDGDGQVSLTDFFYDKKKVSALALNFDVKTNLSGTIRAKADVMVDGQKTMTLAGNLNDENSDSPFNLDFSLIRFPLATVNPFLPEDIAQLTGTLNGNMIVSGDSNQPIFNGEIDFENAAVNVAMTNTAYKFSDVKIPMVNNVVTFNDFNILAANENPLYINGTVDVSSLVTPRYDLTLKADNMMVVNTQKASRNAILYGKGYISLDAKVRGSLRFMMLNANLSILSGTNVTYVLTESTNSITAPSQQDMVKFVNLSDTTAVAMADSLSNENMMMIIDAQLNIQSGTTFTVNLPTGSRDKVQLQANGTVNYSESPMNSGRLTGRIDLTSGFVRYTIPVIGSEKLFNFDPDSYVAFNGDMLNPVLNIHATDRVKCNVTQEGQNSRLVNFDILASITGNLDRMDVVFDLTTDDDLTVANQLQSMTPEQRANQAMNMLLYNLYTGPGNTADFSANPLYSFLESQINNWAAENIKGVDLSFGINQYNQTRNGSTTATMNYSYQVSKSLFNDRFKIVIGGNYSSDNTNEESIAENLISDISFEYFLNKQQTMVIKIFSHMGYESILEGEVTQTGVGFVYRRKLNHLSDIIPKFIRPRRD